jgi:YgiT-type zinc finger domain-containing protein
MKCSVCGSKNVREEIHDLPYFFRKVSTLVRDVRLIFCEECRNSMLTWHEAERVSEMHLSHNRNVASKLRRSKK